MVVWLSTMHARVFHLPAHRTEWTRTKCGRRMWVRRTLQNDHEYESYQRGEWIALDSLNRDVMRPCRKCWP